MNASTLKLCTKASLEYVGHRVAYHLFGERITATVLEVMGMYAFDGTFSLRVLDARNNEYCINNMQIEEFLD